MARIGFIGLGDMGQVIVPRLLDAGHQVTGWNCSPGKAGDLVAAGMALATTPAEASSGADVVLSIVTDAAAVRAVALGPEGVLSGLGSDGIYVDMSTISPVVSREVSSAFADAGRVMLDARSPAVR